MSGDEIADLFGHARERIGHGHVDVTLDRNVDAHCITRLRLTLHGGRPPTGFTKLEARKADGVAESHAPDRAKTHTGGHTNFTGTLRRSATVTVGFSRPGRVG